MFEKGGTYRRNLGVPGRQNQDAYEAAWEHVFNRPMTYVTPDYEGPIAINTDAVAWTPLHGVPGVAEKFFGVFSTSKIKAARYRLEPGASFVAEGRSTYLVLEGSGSVEGQPYRRLTAIYLDDDEHARFVASDRTEVLQLGLPSVTSLADAAANGSSEPISAAV